MTTWGWFKKQVSGKMVNILAEINMFTTCKKKSDYKDMTYYAHNTTTT